MATDVERVVVAENIGNAGGDPGRVEVAAEQSLADVSVDVQALAESVGRLDATERMWLVGYVLGLRREERRRSGEIDLVEEADSAEVGNRSRNLNLGEGADRLTSLLHYYRKLTTTEQGALVAALGDRLACTDDQEDADDQKDADDQEGMDDEEGGDTGRPRGLGRLMEDVAGYKLGASDPLDVPASMDVAEAILVDLRRGEMCLSGVREALEAMDFTFDWQTDDLYVEREAGLAALADAKDTIDSLRAPLIEWAHSFNASRLIELDSETVRAVGELAGSIPWPGQAAEIVVRGAVLHLAGEADAAAIIAKAEADRKLKNERETGYPIHLNDKRCWPFTRADRRPWDADGEAGDDQRQENADESANVAVADADVDRDDTEIEAAEAKREPGGDDPDASHEPGRDVPVTCPLLLQLCEHDFSEMHEAVTFSALGADVPGLCRDVRRLAAQYSGRFSARLSAAVGRDEAGDGKCIELSEDR